MPQLKTVKRIRDIQLALSYAKLIEAHAEDGEYSPEVNHNLVLVLERMDGRTGKREKGRGPALTPVGAASAAKSAKKAGARRR